MGKARHEDITTKVFLKKRRVSIQFTRTKQFLKASPPIVPNPSFLLQLKTKKAATSTIYAVGILDKKNLIKQYDALMFPNNCD